MTPPPSPWWHPDRHADRRPFLLIRNRVQAALRNWFASRDFVEVAPCALVVSPGNETHLHAFQTERKDVAGAGVSRYLHTSPEFACKKLIAAGETRIVTFAPVFRNREDGPLHSPEFTMLEWYRANETYDVIMEDCIAMLRVAADAAGVQRASWKERGADLFAEPERLTLADAFLRHCDVDLPGADRGTLAKAARRLGVHVAADDTWSDLFSRLLGEKIEPHLGFGRATILYEYPASEAALARRKPGDAAVAERFELYVCGVELANCFGELTDPEEQRRRFEADMAEKARIYGERYPLDEDLLAALALMPPTSGAAMGFERLVMLISGARRI
ncbi:MAG: EF-P lysine aminoacylase GenX, partial [Proteobacteria bacterium]|nr:EF-P lysine aminoacylase GenX [Pseudomonadota bacterium]